SLWADETKQYEDVSDIELLLRKARVLHFLKRAEQAAHKAGITTDSLKVVLFVGKGVSNGHAFIDNEGNPVVWFALESYPSEAGARTFVSHEFAHALQYASDPSFAFKTVDEKN